MINGALGSSACCPLITTITYVNSTTVTLASGASATATGCTSPAMAPTTPLPITAASQPPRTSRRVFPVPGQGSASTSRRSSTDRRSTSWHPGRPRPGTGPPRRRSIRRCRCHIRPRMALPVTSSCSPPGRAASRRPSFSTLPPPTCTGLFSCQWSRPRLAGRHPRTGSSRYSAGRLPALASPGLLRMGTPTSLLLLTEWRSAAGTDTGGDLVGFPVPGQCGHLRRCRARAGQPAGDRAAGIHDPGDQRRPDCLRPVYAAVRQQH